MILDPLIILIDLVVCLANTAFWGWFWFVRKSKNNKSEKEVEKNADDIRCDDTAGNTECNN